MEWQLILALAIIIPIILFVPALVWMMAASGLYVVVRDAMRRRARALRLRTMRRSA